MSKEKEKILIGSLAAGNLDRAGVFCFFIFIGVNAF